MTTTRRDFLRAAGTIAGALALGRMPALAQQPTSALRLTILHTNDVHSWLDPFDQGENLGLGGAAARAAFIDSMRAKEEHVLFADSGDTIQGTPYFNLFDGEPEMKAMNAMGCVASTIGNHEFDPGIDRLAELARDHAKFPFLNCNYDFSDTPMSGLTREHLVVEYDGARVGLLGLGIRLEGLVGPDLHGGTRWLDPIPEARRVARHLRHEERCDFIVCLSHISASRQRRSTDDVGDFELAREVPEIDVVLGGHNHWLYRWPRTVWRPRGTGYITQTGWAGTHVGVLQFDLYDKDRRELASGSPAALRAISSSSTG